MRNNRQNQRGFTLIEILGVLLIIATLAGLIFPAMTLVRDKALEVRTHTQLAQYALALELYCQVFGRPPPFLKEGSVVDLHDVSFAFIQCLSGRLGCGQEQASLYDFPLTEYVGKEGQMKVVDAFGNTHISVVFSAQNRLPLSVFPEGLRSHIPQEGIRRRVALYTQNPKNMKWITSW